MRKAELLKHARVLLVDDDTALLNALSDALNLRMRGVAVDTCESAPAALERLGATEYDAIVVDIKMPGMDGLELLGRIRERQPETPTILITGHGEHDLAIQALRGGAQDYVLKPIDRDYFVGSLRHAIERRRLARKVLEQKQKLEDHAQDLEDCLEQRTHDVRELYRREAIARRELEKTTAELEAAHLRRSELISVIAHELATPLTTLRGYAELLNRSHIAPSARDRAKTVLVSETRRMERLVQDLVDNRNDPNAGLPVQRAKSDVAAIAREQVETASGRSKQHEITLDAPDRLDAYCDAGRLAQVFANLLANALTHTPGGRIEVHLQREGRNAHVVVRDHGPGIPTESLPSIFEPRVRLHTGRKQNHANGAGLGLAIARELVEAHGGRIWAESEPGHGTSVHFTLPLSNSRPRRASRQQANGRGR
jgi:signal transduction histidine kinase